AGVPPQVRVTLPWRTRRAPDDAVFARTIFLYWDDVAAHGVAASYRPRLFKVTLQQLVINNPQDGSSLLGGSEPAEWRVFAEVGGSWFFLNELNPGSDILRSSRTPGTLTYALKGKTFAINRPF